MPLRIVGKRQMMPVMFYSRKSRKHWKSRISRSLAELDLCFTIPCQLVSWSTAHVTSHSYRVRCSTETACTICALYHFTPRQSSTSSQSWCTKTGAMFEVGGVRISFWVPRTRTVWLFVEFKYQRTSPEKTMRCHRGYWARTTTALQFIICYVDERSLWTRLMITLSRGHKR